MVSKTIPIDVQNITSSFFMGERMVEVKVGEDIITIDGIDYIFGEETHIYLSDAPNAVRILDHDDYQIDKVGNRYLFTDYESGQWWLEVLVKCRHWGENKAEEYYLDVGCTLGHSFCVDNEECEDFQKVE